MSKLNSCFFHIKIEKDDKLNMKEIKSADLKDVLDYLPSMVEYSYILHDKDKTRPHYHINLRLSTGHQPDTLLYSLASDLMINVKCIYVMAINTDGYYRKQRYLTHKDELDKYKYSDDDVITNNEVNYKLCLEGKNPYILSVDYLEYLCSVADTITDVYRNIGLRDSNTYRNVIRDMWATKYSD